MQDPVAKPVRAFAKLWNGKNAAIIGGLFLLLYVGSQLAILYLLPDSIATNTPFLLTLITLFLTLLAMLVPVFGVNRADPKHTLSKLGLGKLPVRWIFPAVLAAFFAAVLRIMIAGAIVLAFPSLQEGAEQLNSALMFDNTGQMLAIALTASIIVPIYEEIFFRGFVHNFVANWLGKWGSIVVGALIFGVFHLIPVQIVTAFLLGLVLGWLYEKSGSLWIVIICHVVNNSLAMGVLVLAVVFDLA